jgi:hypothetical protein
VCNLSPVVGRGSSTATCVIRRRRRRTSAYAQPASDGTQEQSEGTEKPHTGGATAATVSTRVRVLCAPSAQWRCAMCWLCVHCCKAARSTVSTEEEYSMLLSGDITYCCTLLPAEALCAERGWWRPHHPAPPRTTTTAPRSSGGTGWARGGCYAAGAQPDVEPPHRCEHGAEPHIMTHTRHILCTKDPSGPQ